MSLVHGRVHAKDCEECETQRGLVDQIERVIELQGDFDEAQRQRMLQIADMCPVHRTLSNEVKIRTRLEQ